MIEGFDRGVWTYNVDLNYIEERKNIVIPAHSQFIEFIKPIPITEDILVKCGFIKSESETAVYFNYGTSLLISFPKNDKYFLVSYNGAFYDHVESVHQLMNLYFALTGKELEVKL